MKTGDIVKLRPDVEYTLQYAREAPPDMGDFDTKGKTFSILNGQLCTIIEKPGRQWIRLLSPAGVGWCKKFFFEIAE